MLSLMSFALKALRPVYLFLNLVELSLVRTITLRHLEQWIAMFRGIVMIIENQILQRLFVTIVISQAIRNVIVENCYIRIVNNLSMLK